MILSSLSLNLLGDAHLARSLLVGQGAFELLHNFFSLFGELAFRREPQILLIFNQCILRQPGAHKDVASEQMGLGVIGFELERASDWRPGFGWLVHLPVNAP